MALGINEARNTLSVASNNYAKIQKELDKYNKIFETYAHASPATQMRAASVMRQALNEYNSLKSQQEENALRIYESQNWINYYNNANPEAKVIPTNVQTKIITTDLNQDLPQIEIDTGTYEEEPVIEVTPVIDNSLPGSSNVAYIEATNAQNARNEATMNAVKNSPTGSKLLNLSNQNKVQTSSYKPKTVQYSNTKISPAATSWTKNIRLNTYGAGNVSGIGSGGLTTGLNWRSFK